MNRPRRAANSGHTLRAARMAALFAALAVPKAQACDPAGLGDVDTLSAPGYAIAFKPDPAPIATGIPFALDIYVCTDPGKPAPSAIAIDATMPEHRHGMNYKPLITSRGDGYFRAEGLFLHMPGRWVISFDFTAGSEKVHLEADLVLP